MFGLLEGLFGLLRPGLLGDPVGELNDAIYSLERNPNWSMVVAAATGDPRDPQLVATEFEILLEDIKDSKDTVSITVLRRYLEMVNRMLEIAQGGVAQVPASQAASSPAPVMESPMPIVVESETITEAPVDMPIVPTGISCPHYTAASAYPTNWNDPAAEQRYLDKYPDVKLWVDAMKKRKDVKQDLNALWHYRCYGAGENRTWAGLGGIKYRTPGYLR